MRPGFFVSTGAIAGIKAGAVIFGIAGRETLHVPVSTKRGCVAGTCQGGAARCGLRAARIGFHGRGAERRPRLRRNARPLASALDRDVALIASQELHSVAYLARPDECRCALAARVSGARKRADRVADPLGDADFARV